MPGVKKVVQVGGGVEALDLAAHHRAFLDRGVEHAVQLEIRTVDLLARDLVRRVQALEALARDLPVFFVSLSGTSFGGSSLAAASATLP